jgi:16S rRNA (uracil1498-N3)-methyltransferase
MQKFLISKNHISENTAVITGQDAKHIAKVLRMLPNDKIIFTDGQGKDYISIITKISLDEIILEIKESHDSECESPVKISVFQGMLKDKKMDTLIRHLTELGISKWIPLFCERAIPKPDQKKIDTRIQRWEKISKEALKQCNRSALPIIKKPVAFSDIIKGASQFDLKIIFWEDATASVKKLSQKTKDIKSICIMIGPEGGFSEEEANLAKEAGFEICSLGPRILRAETASITACSLIQHYFGDI